MARGIKALVAGLDRSAARGRGLLPLSENASIAPGEADPQHGGSSAHAPAPPTVVTHSKRQAALRAMFPNDDDDDVAAADARDSAMSLVRPRRSSARRPKPSGACELPLRRLQQPLAAGRRAFRV
jgi:hypothetical protein